MTGTPAPEWVLPDLTAHIEQVNAYTKALAKLVADDRDMRTAYQLQQVAVVLWLGLDPVDATRVDLGMSGESGIYASVTLNGISPEHPTRAGVTRTRLTHDYAWDEGDSRFYTSVIELQRHAGAHLYEIVGPPVQRPWPVIGRKP